MNYDSLEKLEINQNFGMLDKMLSLNMNSFTVLNHLDIQQLIVGSDSATNTLNNLIS